jgi:hypothetical protein
MSHRPVRVTRHAHVIVKHQLTLGTTVGTQTHGPNVRVGHNDNKQHSVFNAVEEHAPHSVKYRTRLKGTAIEGL